MHPTGAALAPRRGLPSLVATCQDLRGHRLPWLALAFGSGVGVYFALPVEPTPAQAAALAATTLALCGLGWLGRAGAGFLAILLAAGLAGGLAAQARTQLVAGPVLGYRYYGAIEGRVIEIDRSASGAPRLTLDRVRLDRMGPAETPRSVRISLHDVTGLGPAPGQRVMTTGHLTPPSGPAEPGGFDFQRNAWFEGLGGIGYSRVPLLLADPAPDGVTLVVARIRAAVGDWLRARMPGQTGQVATAITTGDRSGLSDEVTAALRASNLAHLLAISGLHMGLLVGFVFWSVRGGLALFPPLALQYPTRAWAAAVAFPFALAYLFLSGGSVATQRAFVMAAVMLGAILLGRRALSIRSVALAALLILLWRPESLTGPGFQMSFAATGALVLAFRWASRHGGGWMRGWRGFLVSLLLSSIVAGAATAPIAALHFNRLGQFGVLANVLAVPMMGTLVMPLLLVALLLWPLGLEALPLRIAGWGIDYILWVVEWVASLPGSVAMVHAPGWQVLAVLGFGMTLIGVARGRGGRAAGMMALAVAATLWVRAPRPDILISDDGRLVGILGDNGRWLNRATGAGFVAGVWLENDGDAALQEDAAARPRPATDIVLHVAARKSELPAAMAACAATPGLLVSALEVPRPIPGCDVFDPVRLDGTGAVALTLDDDGTLRQVDARSLQGARPWVEAGRVQR